MQEMQFTKMQGAGNDFVVVDATRSPFALTAPQIRRLADRHFGAGCDQMLVVEPPIGADIDFGYRIFRRCSYDAATRPRCFYNVANVATFSSESYMDTQIKKCGNSAAVRFQPRCWRSSSLKWARR